MAGPKQKGSARTEPAVAELHPRPQDMDADPDTRKWREELAFFNRIREELAKDERYSCKYVAVKDKQVIDSDVDDLRLTERMDEEYPSDVVLIARVGADTPAGELPSPEFRR